MRISSNLVRPDLERLNRRLKALRESASLQRDLLTDTQSTRSWHRWIEPLGAFIAAISIPADAILDTASETPAGRHLAVQVAKKIHDDAAKKRWNGNPFQKQIEAIDKAKDALGKTLPDQYQKILVNSMSNLAKNSLGLLGYLQYSQETGRSLDETIRRLSTELRRLDEEIVKLDQLLAVQIEAFDTDGRQQVRKSDSGTSGVSGAASAGAGIILH